MCLLLLLVLLARRQPDIHCHVSGPEPAPSYPTLAAAAAAGVLLPVCMRASQQHMPAPHTLWLRIVPPCLPLHCVLLSPAVLPPPLPVVFVTEHVYSAGTKLAIVGPNGAGKSTLLKILGKKDQHDAGLISRKEVGGGCWVVLGGGAAGL